MSNPSNIYYLDYRYADIEAVMLTISKHEQEAYAANETNSNQHLVTNTPRHASLKSLELKTQLDTL